MGWGTNDRQAAARRVSGPAVAETWVAAGGRTNATSSAGAQCVCAAHWVGGQWGHSAAGPGESAGVPWL